MSAVLNIANINDEHIDDVSLNNAILVLLIIIVVEVGGDWERLI